MTTLKSRKPLAAAQPQQVHVLLKDDELTVEQFLAQKFENMIEDFKLHSKLMIEQLKREYEDGVISIKEMMNSTTSEKSICVVLKCISGPHIGQKFRLEPQENAEAEFKIGRSTSKQFKEKGVSLYKDKEVSTTHAKIEIRSGEAFIVDVKSTNGSQLNGETLESLMPLRLQDGDVICVGSTELQVQVLESDSGSY